MPKLVDPDARRRHVVDALFRVVIRDGLQRASLRAVADEAELNIGSLRHYFASQQELMDFAMTAMLERLDLRLGQHLERIGDLAAHRRGDQLRLAAGFLGELLPLDEQRRAEVTVFLDFSAAARTNPAFEALSHRTAADTRRLTGRVLARLREAGTLRTDRDLAVEAERLAALLDGLGVSAVLHPSLVSAETCETVLRAHLDELCAQER